MNRYHVSKKAIQLVSTAVMMAITCSALAGKPPPGVPKKRLCKNSLTAVKALDLDFGDFDGTTAGTITVSPDGARTASGPNLAGGAFYAAAFDVSNSLAGCDYYPIRITYRRVPAPLSGPGTDMPADIFTSSPASLFTLSPVPGVPTRVNVGATLSTGASQASGAYTTAQPFRVVFVPRNP